ncbi:MAG: putative SAM-depedent methyltransferase [Myxococcaceae bacterium]|nr:putative SAM-depedent methyltransferase [Myxococcaceae bacterium]
MPVHAFACCQIGSEKLLKSEVARTQPGLRPAFARPGLVTFVSDQPTSADLELDAVFARVWGASLGRATTVDEVIALLSGADSGVGSAKPRLHVFARDPATEGAPAEVTRVHEALVAAGRFLPEPLPKVGELVVDVIVAPGEPWLVGLHRHRAGRWAVPGGQPPIVVPPESPSRAFAKIEEAIVWAGLDVKPGQVALEIGSSPGGAALALARRGVTVWGVDPAPMGPGVVEYRGPSGAQVRHLAIKVGELAWEDLPPRIDWLLLDVHLAPQVALHSIQRFLPRVKKGLKGAVLTLKMNDQQIFEEIPALLERVKRMGFKEVRATHLPSNRSEICCVAR